MGLPLTRVSLMRSRSFCAICSTTFFSCVPLGPMAPGSSPPWPGSSATTIRRSVLPGLPGACLAGLPAGEPAATAVPVSPVGADGLAPGVPGLARCAIKAPSGSSTGLAAVTRSFGFGPPATWPISRPSRRAARSLAASRSFMRWVISCSSGSGAFTG